VKAVKRYVRDRPRQAATAAIAFYRRYPARSNSYIAAAVVTAAGAIGIVVSPESVLQILSIVLPVLLGGEATHRLVTPVKQPRR
jgi:hypothetical protein